MTDAKSSQKAHRLRQQRSRYPERIIASILLSALAPARPGSPRPYHVLILDDRKGLRRLYKRVRYARSKCQVNHRLCGSEHDTFETRELRANRSVKGNCLSCSILMLHMGAGRPPRGVARRGAGAHSAD
ncbi:hypothetical protein EVAR_49274_1 [Eumeta japonica]|uniref:Uncharacterized protein n=1 Tax=Eumeta variegata TaxID=151549 RepID=A0A4C1YJU5_EUMVA|nr:hypothetical protein EVAR_49274_1 [Eumeta japonica]